MRGRFCSEKDAATAEGSMGCGLSMTGLGSSKRFMIEEIEIGAYPTCG